MDQEEEEDDCDPRPTYLTDSDLTNSFLLPVVKLSEFQGCVIICGDFGVN